MLKNYLLIHRQYILIVLTATIFLFNFISPSLSKTNIFYVKNIQVSKKIDTNFSREKVIDEVFMIAFNKMLSKIVISNDIKKLKNLKVKNVKHLIERFQITEETFNKEIYEASFDIFFNEDNLSSFLSKRNLLFSNPKEISLIIFPILYESNKIKIFNENVFYKSWFKNSLNDGILNFVLPVEDIDIVSQIQKKSENIENLEFKNITEKYNINNYAFAIMEIENNLLKIFLKLNLNNSESYKNFSYKVINIENKKTVDLITNDLLSYIGDSWKNKNLINFSSLLNLNLYFKNKSLESLLKLESAINKIKIIKKYKLISFDVNDSLISISYFGDPKQLYQEFAYLNYELKNDQGTWLIKKK